MRVSNFDSLFRSMLVLSSLTIKASSSAAKASEVKENRVAMDSPVQNSNKTKDETKSKHRLLTFLNAKLIVKVHAGASDGVYE